MKIDETTLHEIEDYIDHLDEYVGLKPETIIDIFRAINKYRKSIRINSVNVPNKTVFDND